MFKKLAFESARSLLPKKLRRRLRDEVLSTLVGDVTYFQDGLVTTCNADVLDAPQFAAAYEAGKGTGSWGPYDPKWRTYTCTWAAQHASGLEGDFVECGVNKGGMALTIARLLQFERLAPRKFYLFDTFKGLVPEQLSDREKALRESYAGGYYAECYEEVKRTFAPYANVELVRGVIPESLTLVKIDKVCFLSIDMNCAAPEIMAAEYFWDRLVRGAVVVLDDYGFQGHDEQRSAFQNFARKRGVSVMSMPTGQGLILKP